MFCHVFGDFIENLSQSGGNLIGLIPVADFLPDFIRRDEKFCSTSCHMSNFQNVYVEIIHQYVLFCDLNGIDYLEFIKNSLIEKSLKKFQNPLVFLEWIC